MPRQAREIFGICFKNINRAITPTLRKVLGIVFGIIQIYEHISGMKFSLGNQEVCGRETVFKRRYFLGTLRLNTRISILAAYLNHIQY